jgi:hypothetical protein
MRRTLGVGVVLLLVLLFMPSGAQAQQSGSGSDGARSRLLPNYPNPFNPTTRIPFMILESDLTGGRPAIVTIRIRNPLGEVVGVPRALNHPAGNGAEVLNLEYTTSGVHEAYWDGVNLRGVKVASGLYVIEQWVNGERMTPRTIVVAK